MKSKWKPVLFHTLEFAAILGLVGGIAYFFPEYAPKEAISDVLILVIAAAVKLARISPDIPVKDYVNQDK